MGYGRGGRIPIPAGTRFGRLVVTGELKPDPRGAKWVCLCDCGRTTAVPGSQMISGRTVSCGCRRKETLALGPMKSRIHGHCTGGRPSPEYSAWDQMIRRCTNPNHPSFLNYGGRGISVCKLWRHSFEAFFSDMGPRPSNQYSIDRIDNSGNYEPANCRWATLREQNNNHRRNHNLTWRGETLSMTQWAERLGCSFDRLRSRIRSGMPACDVLNKFARESGL